MIAERKRKNKELEFVMTLRRLGLYDRTLIWLYACLLLAKQKVFK